MDVDKIEECEEVGRKVEDKFCDVEFLMLKAGIAPKSS